MPVTPSAELQNAPTVVLAPHRKRQEIRADMRGFGCLLSVVAALAAGLGVASGQMLWTLALPPLAMWQTTRLRALAIAGAYFLGAGHAILSVGPYLAMSGSTLPPVAYWIAAAGLQALVWLAAWGAEHRALRASVAILFTAVPPLGLLSWAHPLHAAGLLFPSTGVIGLALTLAAIELVIFEPLAIVVVIALALVPSDQLRSHVPPPSWAGMRTKFGDVYKGDDPLGVMDAVALQLRENPALIQVWPESIVPHWNEASEAFWSGILADARARGKTVVFGSTISLPDPSVIRLRNVAVIKGREEATPVDQRTPVPGGTWHPISGQGVPVSPLTSVVRHIGDQRAAFIICFEQLLAWSYLPMIVERPTLLVGMANVYWVQGTAIPAAQSACLKSWARLFNIPFVEAVNQ